MKGSLLTLAIGAALFGPSAIACSMVGGPLSPAQLIARADVIVRATAIGEVHGIPQDGGDYAIKFRIDEVLKGAAGPYLTLLGHLEQKDDFNDRPAPYDFVRPEGRTGRCFASGYRVGAQYLFFLRGGEDQFTVNWAGLAPVNEQLHSTDDEWLRWVRSHVRSE